MQSCFSGDSSQIRSRITMRFCSNLLKVHIASQRQGSRLGSQDLHPFLCKRQSPSEPKGKLSDGTEARGDHPHLSIWQGNSNFVIQASQTAQGRVDRVWVSCGSYECQMPLRACQQTRHLTLTSFSSLSASLPGCQDNRGIRSPIWQGGCIWE